MSRLRALLLYRPHGRGDLPVALRAEKRTGRTYQRMTEGSP